MAPSPRKQASVLASPRKRAQATPTKGTRTSPRKKAWATPPRAASSKIISDIFSEEDFAELNNKSWAEITEEDEELSELKRVEAARKCKSESRRKGVPRKLHESETKPKYVRSLEWTEKVYSQSTRKSQRTTKGGNKVLIESQTRVEVTTSVAESSGLNSRKRCLSNASTINEDVSPSKRRPAEQGSGKPARKNARARLFNSASSTDGSVPSSPSSRKDHWEQPTLGWCEDENVLKRRTREIERAKEKAVYKKYIGEVAIKDRIRGVDPRTPNKMINYSRRSWDTQIKKWKRSLYEWAGEEPSDSVNTSFCSYTSDDAMSAKEEEMDLENTPVLKNIEITVRPEADNMASLLGKFDIDSRMGGDESTLKAPNQKLDPSAPVDFQHAKF